MTPRERRSKASFDSLREGAIREEINRKAYERFELRGRIHGFHVEDWLSAEREVRSAKKVRSAARTRKRMASPRSRTRKKGSDDSHTRA
ncbi:MAG TPA: DUF2934 domain-containing protein [Nitrospiria bacterium]